MPKTMDEFIQEHSQRSKTIKGKVVDIWNKGITKVKQGVKWVKDNPQEAAIIGTIATGIGAGLKRLGKSVDKYVTERREMHDKDTRVYDCSAKAYVHTKKRLNNNDIVRIDELRRRNPGMRMTEALARLDLLK